MDTCLERMLAKDQADRKAELSRLTRRISEAQATVDSILLRAAQAQDDLAGNFMRLARQKQRELAALKGRIEQVKKGNNEDGRCPAKVVELTQNLLARYVTFPPSQKRQVVESVFSNLQLDDVNLCGQYRLPFSILAKNAGSPLNYARQDSNLRPSV